MSSQPQCQCWIQWCERANVLKGEKTAIYLQQISEFWYIWIATLLYQEPILWSPAIQHTWYVEDR